MNASIVFERNFSDFYLVGSLIVFAYDFLRIIRRLIVHNNFFVSLEDLIFWVITSVFIFSMLYKENNGIIRGFSIAAMLIGMLVYYYLFSDLFVNGVSKFIKFIMGPAIRFFVKIKKGLKKYCKSVKIILITRVNSFKKIRNQSKNKKKKKKKRRKKKKKEEKEERRKEKKD